MTGYGYAQVLNDAYQIEVEIKGYNNRYLEISHLINYALSAYEVEIDDEIKKVASRGHIDLNVRLKQFRNPCCVMVDEGVVKAYAEAFSRISSATGTVLEPQLSDYLAIEGVVSNVKNQDVEVYRKDLFQALSQALTQFDDSRRREGAATKKDLKRLGEGFAASLEIIRNKAGELEEFYKKSILDKYHELLDDKKIDENRFLQEVANLLVKYSINEEQNRLFTHLKEYNRLLESDESVGKRLDFLCQEMNREVNTTGSKSQLADINLQVVAMKDNLENIREQVRNIE